MFWKKSQVGVEFIIFVGISFVLAILLLGFSLKQASEHNRNAEALATKDLGLWLQKETIMASNVEGGYMRNFIIPERLERTNFTIINSNNSVAIITRSSIFIAPLPTKTGNFTKGTNKINKTNGIIYVN